MVVHRRRRKVVKRHRARGAGFFDALKSANSWLRDNKVISTVGNALGSVGVPYASNIASVAGKLGYGYNRRRPIRRRAGGRKRRVGRPRRARGAGFFDALKSANSWLRDNKVISTVGNALGSAGVPYASNIASVAGKLGYGYNRRRPIRRRRARGAGFFDAIKSANSWLRDNKVISTVGNALGSVGVPYASNIASVAGKLGYGYNRRRPIRHRGGGFSTEQIAACKF